MGWGRSHLDSTDAAFKRGAAMSNLLHPNGVGPSHGRITIYSAPKAVLTHIQWSLGEAVGAPINLHWQPQPLRSGTWCTHLNWSSSIGAGSRIASTLMGWHYLCFEVYEAAGNGSDGSLFLFTQELGLYRADVNSHGDIVVNENQILRAMKFATKDSTLILELEKLLGNPWHEYLEPFRRAELDEANILADRISV